MIPAALAPRSARWVVDRPTCCAIKALASARSWIHASSTRFRPVLLPLLAGGEVVRLTVAAPADSAPGALALGDGARAEVTRSRPGNASAPDRLADTPAALTGAHSRGADVPPQSWWKAPVCSPRVAARTRCAPKRWRPHLPQSRAELPVGDRRAHMMSSAILAARQFWATAPNESGLAMVSVELAMVTVPLSAVVVVRAERECFRSA